MYKLKISIITFLLFLVFLTQTVLAQSDSTHIRRWSATIIGGVFIPGNVNHYNKSINMGYDISYNYTPYIAIYINTTYNFLNNSGNYSNFQSQAGLLESTMGVKFYADTVFFKLFTELGFGYYKRILHYKNSQYEYTDNLDDIGVNFGLGADFRLNSNISFMLKGKLNFTNVTLSQKAMNYYGIYSGIKYNF